MSRVGKSPITIPTGVSVNITDKDVVVSGSKGNLTQPVLEGITIKQEDNQILVSRTDDEPKHRANHGLMRTLIFNMVTGVSQGFTKKLEVNGVGYRVQLQGNGLKQLDKKDWSSND